MREKFVLGLFLATAMLLAVTPVQATKLVYVNFNGDPNFPSLTWQENTAGLRIFTGGNFGLTGPQADTVKVNMLNQMRADFAAYDVSFTTDSTCPYDYTLGVDERAYVFTEDNAPAPVIDPYVPCPSGHVCHRLFGKAMNSPGATDQFGNNIYWPTFARVFAGGYTLGAGTASPSDPTLLGAGAGPISVALGNIGTHEVSHFFGIWDPGSHGTPACTDAELYTNVNCIGVESIESTRDKSFTRASARETIMDFLGPEQSCLSNADCSSGQVCISGGCHACTDTSQCAAGEVCSACACVGVPPGCIATEPASLTYDVCYGSEDLVTKTFDIVNNCNYDLDISIEDSQIPCAAVNGQCVDPFELIVPANGRSRVMLVASGVLGDSSNKQILPIGDYNAVLAVDAIAQGQHHLMPVTVRVSGCVPEFPTVALPLFIIGGLLVSVVILKKITR